MRIKALGLVLVMGTSASLAMAADQRSYNGGRFSLDIGGANAGFLKSARGGGVSGDVATSNLGPSTTQKKHVSKLKFEPLTIEIGPAMSNVVSDWIDATLTSTAQGMAVTLRDCSVDNKAIFEQALTNSLITEIGFPALDASSKDGSYLKVKISPEYSQRKAGTGAACAQDLGVKQKVQLQSSFKVELDGIDTRGVSSVDAFSIKVALAADSIGEAREPLRAAAKVEIPNLTLTVSRARSADFETWAEDFLVKGNNSDDKEKSGAIVFIDPAGKETARLSLSHVGISALTYEPGEAARVKVSLYVEGMRYSVGGVQPKAVKSAAVAAKVAPAKVAPAKAVKKK